MSDSPILNDDGNIDMGAIEKLFEGTGMERAGEEEGRLVLLKLPRFLWLLIETQRREGVAFEDVVSSFLFNGAWTRFERVAEAHGIELAQLLLALALRGEDVNSDDAV